MIEGLKKAIEIIEKEKEYAMQVNPQMAFGMSQVLRMIKEELKVEQNKSWSNEQYEYSQDKK